MNGFPFSRASTQASMPSLWGIQVYSDLTYIVTKSTSFGIVSSFSWFRSSVASFK